MSVSRIDEVCDRFAGWLDSHKHWFVALFSLCYFPIAILITHYRLFWYDELFTYYICRAPSIAQMMTMIRAGIDHHPPAYFLLVRAASWLGDPQTSMRLPSIAGYWLACVCVYVFVRRRTSALYGAAAALMPFALFAFQTVDARPYGLLLGFSGLALVEWQAAGEGNRRLLHCVFLALAGAAAVMSQYFGVLLFVALGTAEIVRSFEQKRVNWPVWVALVVDAGVTVAHLPLVHSSISGFAAKNWASPYPRVSIDIYSRILVGVTEPLVACLLLTGLWLAVRPRPNAASLSVPSAVPLSEVVAGCVMLLQPPTAHLLAVLFTNKIHDRYVIGLVLGFAIVAGFILYRAARGSALFGLMLLTVLGATAAFRMVSVERTPVRSLPPAPLRMTGDLPIVIDDPQAFFRMWHYGRGPEVKRYRYLVDIEASSTLPKLVFDGRAFLDLRKFIGVPAVSLDEFRSQNKRFVLFTDESVHGWALQKYVSDGASVKALWAGGVTRLFIVEDTR